jgi:kynurenine formamidase
LSEQDSHTSRTPLTRRHWLSAAATLASSEFASSDRAVAASSAPLPAHAGLPVIEHDDDLERALPLLSNWGRWGSDDQIGTLNFITAQASLAAARLIRSGRVVPLAREMSPATSGLRQLTYHLKRYQDALPEEAGCLDEIGMIYHGFAVTHMDALCHIFTPEGRQGMYNGYPIEDVTPSGARRLGIEHIGARGIVGRGVLLDLPALHGGPLPIGSIIRPADLEAAERLHDVHVGEGDILFVRNGGGPGNTLQHGTGLHASCLGWLRARRVAVISSDCDSDVHPAQPGFARWSEPIHMVAIPYLGMPILDNTELDALAAACAAERRWAFFVSIAPWRFKGATSSPVNPLAMF